MHRVFRGCAPVVATLLCVAVTGAQATTYQVPSVSYPTLQAVAPVLNPNDIVEVQGNATYSGGVIFEEDGTPSQPITIRGIRVAGKRPRLHGGTNVVKLDADNYVFEGFEITGVTSPLTSIGIFCVGDNVTVRDCVVHDCPRHGILGGDQFSGDTTIEHVEVHHCGNGTNYHQMYMATDNMRHPTGVVRIQYCYIHDAVGGNSIKTRAARNEIRYNWVEGAMFHELELIGADLDGQDSSVTEGTVREDSEVIGNVFDKVTTSTGAISRIGSDATGDSFGRYRFVNNTMLMRGAGSAAIRLQEHVQSLSLIHI